MLRDFLIQLTDRMLRHDFSTTLNQSYLILITLASIKYQSRGSVSLIYPFLGQWSMKSVICTIVFNFFLSILVLIFLFSVCDVDNKKYFQACFPDQFFTKSSLFKFFFLQFFLTPCYSVRTTSLLQLLLLLLQLFHYHYQHCFCH